MSRALRKKLRRLLVVSALLVVFCLVAGRHLRRDVASISPSPGHEPRRCAPPPRPQDLHRSNEHWQLVVASGASCQLLGAYHDARAVDAVVRLIAMADTANLTARLYCQLWPEGSTSALTVVVAETRLVWHDKWQTEGPGVYHPYLVTCALPPTLSHLPSAVSLVNARCDTPTNILKVVYQPPETVKRNFAVCVKALDYLDTDYSLRLVEWIELVRLLGADKIIIYTLHVHPNMSRVLDLYRRQGIVEVIPVTLPGDQPNEPNARHAYLSGNKAVKRLNEVASLNDCFYRNFLLFEYVVVLDVDEVIMPLGGARTWLEMLAAVRSNATRQTSFYARHVYFFDGNLDEATVQQVPEHLFMSRHVYRAAKLTAPTQFVKTLFDTDGVITLHNHLPLSCRAGSGRRCARPLPTWLGRTHHYRADCDKGLRRRECGGYRNNSVLDTNIWRYTDQLAGRTLSVIRALGLDDYIHS